MKVLLGVRLFQKSAPELVGLFTMKKHQFAVLSGQPIVDHDVDPLTVLPEAEVKYSGVRSRSKALIWWHDALETGLVQCQIGEGGHQPAITEFPLIDIEPRGSFHEKLRIFY